MTQPGPTIPPDQLQLLERLRGRDADAANAAVARIFRLGPALAGALLSLRGDTQYFAGKALFNPRSSILFPVAIPGRPVAEEDKYTVLTVEAAALYLLSAIQHGQLHFAGAPLLDDPAQPIATREVENTPQRLQRAFDAAQAWYRNNPSGGVAGSGVDPIAASGLAWY